MSAVKYEFAKVKQKGGGAWGTFSFDNDMTHDILFDFRKDKVLVNNTKANKLLAKMYGDEDEQLKKEHPNEKNLLFSDYQLYTHAAGVVIYLALQCRTIKKEFLKRALIEVYKDYLKLYIIKEASGWKDYRERMRSLNIEIHLLNYCLNHGSLEKIVKHLSENINTVDILAGDIFINKNSVKVMKYINAHKKDFADHLFLSKSGKLPRLDPNIPYLNTVMQGNDGYFINQEKNGKRKWIPFNSYDNLSYNYLDDDFLSSIYGKK
uniref:Uncharacterized protein n=1 Tax=viral metagenome TaxID=1070528 RepID=A0A6C0C930_9ZZZZ